MKTRAAFPAKPLREVLENAARKEHSEQGNDWLMISLTRSGKLKEAVSQRYLRVIEGCQSPRERSSISLGEDDCVS